MESLKMFYDNYDEDNRLRSRHGMVEFLTTLRYIEKYLRPGMKMVEIGAGTGRYSHYFAQKGYCVDSLELVESNIEVFKRNTLPNEPVTIRQGDARDLSVFSDESFDVTLLLGPMYHLFRQEDKMQALSEAVRVTKKGGIVFVAYCGNDSTILQFCFLRGMLMDERYRKLVDLQTFKAGSDPAELFELNRKEEIEALRSNLDVTPLHFVAADGYANYMRQSLAEMEEELYELYLRYHFATCERQDMVGYSNHFLDIFRKN
jgi:ubiquinone/menaquinone biosynthesis C-methylase UbiE